MERPREGELGEEVGGGQEMFPIEVGRTEAFNDLYTQVVSSLFTEHLLQLE